VVALSMGLAAALCVPVGRDEQAPFAAANRSSTRCFARRD
jgi:hypothetical protein